LVLASLLQHIHLHVCLSGDPSGNLSGNPSGNAPGSASGSMSGCPACRFVWQSGKPFGNLAEHLFVCSATNASACICLHLHLSANLFCHSVLQNMHLMPAHLAV
jgi:hypothetical protein